MTPLPTSRYPCAQLRTPKGSWAVPPAEAVSESSSIRVALLAGNRLLREALGRILRKTPDMIVSGESSDSPNLLTSIVKSATDVVLLAPLNTSALNLQFVNSVCRAKPRVQVVMVGMDENESVFLEAVRAGVTGYLLKDASAMDVISAIRAVLQGDAVCPPRLCRALFTVVARGELSIPGAVLNRHLGLTRREVELVPMIARGFTNKEIASHLSLSEQTIKNHIHRILRKLGADHRVQVLELVSVQDQANPVS